LNQNYEEAEENGGRVVTAGDSQMKRRQTEKRFTATTSTAGPKERMDKKCVNNKCCIF
jgi:hypothetical protein